MIGVVQVRVSAAHPDFPLREVPVFCGSACSLAIEGAPCYWNGISVTGVSVAIKNADGETRSVSAKRSGSLWVATFPAADFSNPGTVRNGVTVIAAGKDESDASATWTLGVGDLTVISAAAVPAPGVSWQDVHLRDSVPSSPVKGDLAKHGGTWKLYTGSAWEALDSGGGGGGAVDSVNGKTGTVVLTGSDIKISGDSESTVKGFVVDHVINTDNPHEVTAAQVGALTQTAADGRYVQTTDSRLTNARTPTAHKGSHATGGEDALEASDIGAVPVSGGYMFNPTGTVELIIGGTISNSSQGGSSSQNLHCPGVLEVYGSTIPVDEDEDEVVPASIKKDGKEVATEEQVTAARGLSAYPISATTGALADRTVNTSASGGSFTFPSRTGTSARDFVVSIESSATAPTVSFPATVSYVSDDSDVWTAEAGKTNVWYFSEVLDDVFMVSHKALDSVSQS